MQSCCGAAAGNHEQDSQGVHHEPGLRPGQGCQRVIGGRGPVQVGPGDGDLRPRGEDRRSEERANAAGRSRPAQDPRPPQQEAQRTEDDRRATSEPQATVPGHDREEGEARIAGSSQIISECLSSMSESCSIHCWFYFIFLCL